MIHRPLTASRRTARGTAAAAISLLTMSSTVQAVDSKDNAALKFWQAWAQISPDALAALGTIEPGAMSQPDWKVPEALVTSGALEKSLIGALERAAMMDEADFGIEYDLWPQTIVAHLSPMRNGARLLAINARIALDAGENAAAARSIVAGYGVARHLSKDGTVISALIGMVVFTMTDGVARYGVELGAFDAADRAAIRHALAEFGQADPFGVQRALAFERDQVIGWLRTAGGKGEKSQVASNVGEALSVMDPDPEDVKSIVEALSGREDLESQLALYSRFHDQVFTAWERPDAAAMLVELQKGMRLGAFGGIAQMTLPALTKLHERDMSSRALLKAARDRVAE